MGNPSDGFYGKTIALSISNFWADVTIFESAKLVCTSRNNLILSVEYHIAENFGEVFNLAIWWI